MKMYRQGDVFLERIEEYFDSDFELVERDNGRVVLAYGEATGHAHAIKESNVKLYKTKSTPNLYLVVDNDKATLSHEEHAPIVLEPGKYKVVRQVQYVPRGIQTVLD